MRSLLAALGLALLLAACDGGGSGESGSGAVSVSASRIALATVYYPGTQTRGGFSRGSVTVVVRAGAAVSRADLVLPDGVRGAAASVVGRGEDGTFVRIVWDDSATPGKALLRVVVKGTVTTLPITFEAAPAGAATRSVTLSEQATHVRPTLALPGTAQTATAVLGVSWPTALTLTLGASTTVTLAAPVVVPAKSPFTATIPVTFRLSAAATPGRTDTLFLNATDPDGVLVATGQVIVRATAPLAGARVPYVTYTRALWPYPDTTGIRNAYRYGSVRYGTAHDLALRADGRVFVDGDTLRSGRVPGAFRAVSIGGAVAVDAAGDIWKVTEASGGTTQASIERFDFPIDPVTRPEWGRAVTAGSGFGTYATDLAIYRSVVGFADGWVRDVSAVGGVANIAAARVPSAPVVVGGGHVSSVAMTADGAVYGWGSNRDAMVGTDSGPEATFAAATRVAGLPPMASISIGPYAVTGTDRAGVRWGWGLLPDTPATAACPLRTFNERRCTTPVRLP